MGEGLLFGQEIKTPPFGFSFKGREEEA